MVARRRARRAKGDTVLLPGDQVCGPAKPEDVPLIQLMFGRPEEE